MNIADYIKKQLPYWPNWINIFLLKCNFFGRSVYGPAYKKVFNSIGQNDNIGRLLELVNYAIESVPYYRERYKGLKLNTLEDFEKHIGFIDKDEVMAHWDEFISDGTNLNQCIVGTTGGTSGKPLKLALPKNRYKLLAFWHKELMSYGWNYDSRAVIRNHHLPEGRKFMVNPIMKEFIFDAFSMCPEYAKYVLNIMRRYNVRYIHAYPSGAYQFLKFCYNQGLDTSFIRLCILTSEGVTDEQRHFIVEQLGIQIHASYGHSEILVMAGNYYGDDYYRIEEDYGYCELLGDDGQIIKGTDSLGQIIGTTFINKYMPLIRYKTGDYSSYGYFSNDRRGLNAIQGRHNNSLIYKSDGSTTTITALNLHGDIYEHIDGLQYIQDNVGELIVNIIPNQKYTEDDEKYLLVHLHNAMGKDSNVEIRHVERQIFQPNGKFLPLISKVHK